MSTESFKVVVIGDGAVGKTCMLVAFSQGTFPNEYVPTVFDNYRKSMFYKGKKYELALWDTAGQEEYGKMRKMSYPETDCFVIGFSMVDRNSLKNVEEWSKELDSEGVGHIPIVLAGCKCDLVKDEKFVRKLKEEHDDTPVTVEEAEEMMRTIGSFQFVELSAKTGHNLDSVFQSIVIYLVEIKQRIERRKEKKKGLGNIFSSVSGDNELNKVLNEIEVGVSDDEDN